MTFLLWDKNIFIIINLLLNIIFCDFLDTDDTEENLSATDNETVRFIQELAKTDGKLESPIDLNISYMKVVKLNPVQWLNYNVTPKKMKLTNTGYTG